MNNTMKWILAVVVIIAVMLGIYGTISYFKTDSNSASLGMNIEDYDSYIKYNGGINTELPITTTGLLTSGTFTAGATTLTGALIGTSGSFSSTLGVTSNATVGGSLTVTGAILGLVKTSAVAKTSIYSTTTLVAADSGKAFIISASGTTITLPSVYATGTILTFTIGGAMTTASTSITSAEGDNIEGSLIVAGAVVDCDDADSIKIDDALENIGDNVTILSNGIDWIVLQNGFLTAVAAICSG